MTQELRDRAASGDAPRGADEAFRRARAALDAFARRPDDASYARARAAVRRYRELVVDAPPPVPSRPCGVEVALLEFLRASDEFSSTTPGRAHGTRTRHVRRSLVVIQLCRRRAGSSAGNG